MNKHEHRVQNSHLVIRSKADSYSWGKNCHAINLVDEENISIKEELIPPGESETVHLHEYASQFFYILSGQAHFVINGSVHEVTAGNGIWVKNGDQHKISNKSTENLVFLVTSNPPVNQDRLEITE